VEENAVVSMKKTSAGPVARVLSC